MLIGFLNNYKLKKQYEKRYNDIIAKSKASVQEEISVKNAKPQAISLGIDSAIIDEVLQELDVFEKGEAYLTNQISLKDVAKIVNTNSKYLSKIVNTYKGKNFTTYINDLRIDYLVSHVQTDTKFQKYTIRAIAEEIGFSNPEGFSRAFQKKTGLKPSYFIKKVRETAVKKQ
jgi:AraC-like DNA-binding protein